MIRAVFGAALVLAPLTAFAVSPALALNWRVAPAESAIGFEYREDGEEAQGAFTKFKGVAEFDAARPERARLDLEIQIDSIDLSDGWRSDFVKTETWFDAENFPIASFTLDRIAPVSDAPTRDGAPRRYEVVGVLTIKGESKPIRTTIELTLEPRRARAVGRVAFKRSDFDVGDRLAGFFVEIGDEVAVSFDLVANRI